MNYDQTIISVDIKPLFKLLEKEISVVLDNVSNKNIAEYINLSIIFFITKLQKDKPNWSMQNEMYINNETFQNILTFNQNYMFLINDYLTKNVPLFFPIDSYYNVLNKHMLDLNRDDLLLHIKKITPEEWMIFTTSLYIQDLIEFEGYIPERLRESK